METNDLTYIAFDLRALAVPVESLHNDPANARTGHAVERIAASLRQYGQRKPIVVNRSQGNKIEAGNGAYLAALSLGWTHIAVVFVEDDPATAAGYGIADNRVAEFSEWDLDALEELGEVTGDLYTGFEATELDDLLGKVKGSASSDDPGQSGYKEQYGVIVICAHEAEQEQVYNQLLELGYNCRVVVT